MTAAEHTPAGSDPERFMDEPLRQATTHQIGAFIAARNLDMTDISSPETPPLAYKPFAYAVTEYLDEQPLLSFDTPSTRAVLSLRKVRTYLGTIYSLIETDQSEAFQDRLQIVTDPSLFRISYGRVSQAITLQHTLTKAHPLYKPTGHVLSAYGLAIVNATRRSPRRSA